MKPTAFYIVLSIRTCEGYENFGKFFIGNDPASASAIFRKLKGKAEINEDTILQLELRETRNGLPLNIQMITCTLEELAENCKIITKEKFKLLNLEKNG